MTVAVAVFAAIWYLAWRVYRSRTGVDVKAQLSEIPVE
jgi:hypothetical protein